MPQALNDLFFNFGTTKVPQISQEKATSPKQISFSRNLENSEIGECDCSGKGGHREIMKIRLINSGRSWIRDQYLPENMKYTFADTG